MRTMANDSLEPGFDEFVLQRSSSLYRTAVLLTRDPRDAQDLLQDALARAWRSWSRIEGQPEAYCRAIVVRQYVSWRRRRWHGERATEHLPETPVHERLAGAPTGPGAVAPGAAALSGAIASLPPRQRAVIVLRYFHDYTEAQTAEAKNVAVGTVKSQHAKALAHLRISHHLSDDAQGNHDHSAATEGRGV